jgi:phosphopentomutase
MLNLFQHTQNEIEFLENLTAILTNFFECIAPATLFEFDTKYLHRVDLIRYAVPINTFLEKKVIKIG